MIFTVEGIDGDPVSMVMNSHKATPPPGIKRLRVGCSCPAALRLHGPTILLQPFDIKSD
ncbi:hypothetical protein [Klebsiella pneumoniae]|uniref:hypothetical protein n=1 Tax=Klebsiella pneumoniae TaxID=573 RepID=UPI002E7869B0|nr:hypothetical protein [Klebsiella pneumoniae]